MAVFRCLLEKVFESFVPDITGLNNIYFCVIKRGLDDV